jgi:hypothetical protein
MWIGIALLLGLSPAWSWIVGGAGALVLVEVAIRLLIPEYRARPGGRLTLAMVLMVIGFGTALGGVSWWPLILIAIGISLLVNRLFD